MDTLNGDKSVVNHHVPSRAKMNGRLHRHVKYIKWQVTPSRQDMAGYTLTAKYGIWQVTQSLQNMAYDRLHTPGYSNITGTTSHAS